ncbi:hypothetical protein [Rhodococcus sp. PvR099]|uniref:hypothetical protein n=1 Tax=Rhodococcus sp. PvR099 TaxID=2806602 RepID=UPI001AE172EB|nr:hypothetical protein [Rhodococcus sp. PvR099]MBP1161603.1 hypothetical protein [Rhodococcus sp. PvR099]
MHRYAAPPRPAGVSGRVLALLVALAAALVAAFVVAPRTLAAIGPGEGFSDQSSLLDAVRETFVAYWSTGDRDFSPGMEGVVDYWVRYHVAKGAIAAILLVALVVLGVLLWKSFANSGGTGAVRRAALAAGGVLVTMLALFSLVVVMANVQGAVAPFSSLMSMLPVGETDGELADTLGQVRQQLADPPSAGGDRIPPALDVMISDFSRYHAVMAVIAAMVAAVLVGLSVVLWKWFASTESSARETRRMLGSCAVLSAVVSLGMIVVGLANTTTAADPTPALLAFFDGGFV